MISKSQTLLRILLGAFLALTSATAFGQSITVQGRVVDANGVNITGSTQFRVQILSPNTDHCILYDESRTLDLTGSNGLFSINIGSTGGTRVAPTTYTLEQVLSNRGILGVDGSFCDPVQTGTIDFTPAASDNRKLTIQFQTGSSAWETIPEMDLNPVPFAMDARNLGGFPATQVVRVSSGTAPLLSPADVSDLNALLDGSSTKFVSNASGKGAQLPSFSSDPSGSPAGSVWFDTVSNTLKYRDNSGVVVLGAAAAGGAITSVSGTGGLTGSGSSGAVSLSMASISGVAGSYGSGTSVPVLTVDGYGRITVAGSTPITGAAPTGTASGDLSGSFPGPTVAKIRGASVSATAPASGQFYRFDDKGTPATTDDEWVPVSIHASDLKDNASGALFPGACAANQTFFFNGLTGGYDCGAIAGITSSQLATSATLPAGGTFRSVTVDTKGLVTAGTNPTTIAAYGITDALRNADGTVPSISSGTEAAMPLPIAGNINFIYIANDTKKIFRQIAGTWEVIGAAPGAGFTGSLAGDVTGSQGATVVSNVGGSTAANVNSGTTLANQATDANTFSRIVRRDASGNFAATNATLGQVLLKDSSTNTVSLKAGTTSASYSLQLPTSAPAAGQALQSDAAGILSWVNAAAGSLNNILSGTGINITGSGATRTVTLADTTVSAGSYGSATQVPSFTVDAQGRLTAAANVAITGITPGGTASGDLSGTYPGPTVAGLRGVSVSASPPSLGSVLQYGGANWAASLLGLNDLKDLAGTGSVVANAACSSEKALTYNPATKTLDCQTIGSLNASALTAGTIAAARLPTSATAWTEASGDVYRATGKVGIGTTLPGSPLDVKGAIQLSGATSGYAGFKPATNAGSTIWTLPSADGSSNQVLKTDGAGNLGWASASAVTAVGGSAPIVSSGGATPTISLSTGNGLTTSANNLVVVPGTGITVTAGGVNVAYGTAAGTAAQGNDGRLSDARAPSGAAGGDLSGTYPNPSVVQLQGRALSSAAPSTGQALIWNGSAWAPGSVAAVPSACGSGQVLTSNGTSLVCTNSQQASNPNYRCTSGSQTYTAIGSYSFSAFSIPAGCKNIQVSFKGGGGGTGSVMSSGTVNAATEGGSGTLMIANNPSNTLNFVVGGSGKGGGSSNGGGPGSGGFNYGGSGGRSTNWGSSYGGGGGGGRTEISVNSTLIAVASGGGGSGGAYTAGAPAATYHGTSATSSAVGAGGSGTINGVAGSGSSGGNGPLGYYIGGGGGGGGYFGGGSGATHNSSSPTAGDGGKGSVYLNAAQILSGSVAATGGGAGGAASTSTTGNDGGDGSVSIAWGPDIDTCSSGGSLSFSASGSYSYSLFGVPYTCTTVTVSFKGGGGGTGSVMSSGTVNAATEGGSGTLMIANNPSNTLNFVVGGSGKGGGSSGGPGAGGFNYGGSGGRSTNWGSSYGGGGGGGRTEISVNSTLIAVASGGGGSGGAYTAGAPAATYHGASATSSAVGAGGTGAVNGVAGSGSSGGNGPLGYYIGGGGGGGGYFGGGSGATHNSSSPTAGDGGKGSVYLNAAQILSGSVAAAGGGAGGAASTSTTGNDGGSGSVTITWSP